MITTAKFQGHGAAVLCLDVSTKTATTQPALLLSGSEDGTARLWDLRDHRRRACLCIRVPNGSDVLSAVFAPKSDREGTEAEPATATTPFAKDCNVFLGVENTVLEYDLRHSDSPIVSSEPTRDWGRILQNQDEVNQIGLVYFSNNKSNDNGNTNNHGSKKKKKKGGGNKKKQQQQSSSSGETNTGNSSLYLVACDDAGKARWTEVRSSSCESETTNDSDNNNNCNHDHASSTILHHDNHGVAILPTCAFRPNSYKRRGGGGGASLELATGGTDCKIQLWDIFRPKKPLSTFTINQKNTNEGQSKPQVCNPPFVYSLAWSNDGKSLAAGLGDGTVGVFEINNRTLVQSQLLVGSSDEGSTDTVHFAHESSVASVVYPSFSASTSDRVVCSAGSDGSIVFWDLGKPNDEQWDDVIGTTPGGNTDDENSDDAVARLFPPRLLQGLCGKTHNIAAERKKSAKPRMLFNIPHGEKINWVTTAVPLETSSSQLNDTVFVADTSPVITSYTIPF